MTLTAMQPMMQHFQLQATSQMEADLAGAKGFTIDVGGAGGKNFSVDEDSASDYDPAARGSGDEMPAMGSGVEIESGDDHVDMGSGHMGSEMSSLSQVGSAMESSISRDNSGFPLIANDPTAPWNALVRGIDSEIEDALDAQGVANELLEDWKEREERALKPQKEGSEAWALHPQVRQTALRFVGHIAQLVGLPQKSWYEATTLLDVYILKTVDSKLKMQTAIEDLPSICSALVAILKKNDCATALVSPSNFVPQACLFAQYLQTLGLCAVNKAVTCEMIKTQEKNVLEALGWRINVPTTESWTSTYSARFNVLTRSSLKPSLEWVWQCSLFGARLIMMRQAVNEELPPRVLAAGLLGMGLVGARLLPLEAIRPPQMTSEEWKQLYEQIQPQEPQPTCVFEPRHVRCFLELLQVTVGADLADIKEDCRLAFVAMWFAVKEAQELNKVQGMTAQGPSTPQPSTPPACPPVQLAHHATI